MGGNRANPEENHPEAGRFTSHLQTSFSTKNGLGSNLGRVDYIRLKLISS